MFQLVEFRCKVAQPYRRSDSNAYIDPFRGKDSQSGPVNCLLHREPYTLLAFGVGGLILEVPSFGLDVWLSWFLHALGAAVANLF